MRCFRRLFFNVWIQRAFNIIFSSFAQDLLLAQLFTSKGLLWFNIIYKTFYYYYQRWIKVIVRARVYLINIQCVVNVYSKLSLMRDVFSRCWKRFVTRWFPRYFRYWATLRSPSFYHHHLPNRLFRGIHTFSTLKYLVSDIGIFLKIVQWINIYEMGIIYGT